MEERPRQWNVQLTDRIHAELRIPFCCALSQIFHPSYGLSRVLQNERRLLLVAVGAIAITITISDVLANRAAFTSAYNWFHM